MNTNKQNTAPTDRIHWMDNLRTFMIFLVVVIHAGLVYESSGISAFFWIVDDPSTNDLSGILNLIVDIVALPAIFFVSGFFVPLSLSRTNGLAFLKFKFKRLMIPWVLAVLTLIPLYKVLFLYSRGLPQEHWTTYFHWTNGIWDQNWLWFLPVLFLFNAIYLGLSRTGVEFPDVRLGTAVAIAASIGFLCTFGMQAFGLMGWTKTFFFDFQNERILIYFLAFMVGSLCCKLGTFRSEPKSKKAYVLMACTGWIPVNLYLFLVIYSLINPGRYLLSRTGDALLIQASYVLSLLCLLYLAVNTFRFYLNRKGRIWRELNRNSYGVYIIHVIVLGVMAIGLLQSSIPSIVKHLLLVILTFAVSNAIVSAFRRARTLLTRESRGSMNRQLTRGETSA